MVNGVQGYSNMDIWKQQAQKRAAQWAQANAQQQAAQQADSSLYVQQPVAQQTGYVQQNVPQPTTTQEDDGTYKCTDGNDDGHIGFWNATGHALKGAGKFIAGLAGFEWGADGKYKGWSGTKVLQTIAIGGTIAALCLFTGGTAIPAIIAGAGVAMAAGGVGKSIYRAATAKTDAECKAAFNDLGSDGLALALSLVGAKASMKQYATVKGLDAAKYDGVLGTARTAWDSATLGFKQAGHGLKAGYSALKQGGFDHFIDVGAKSCKNFGNIVKDNYAKAVKTPTTKKTEDLSAKFSNDKIKNENLLDYNKGIQAQSDVAKAAHKYFDDISSLDDALRGLKNMENVIANLKSQLNNSGMNQQQLTQKIDICTQTLEAARSIVNQKFGVKVIPNQNTYISYSATTPQSSSPTLSLWGKSKALVKYFNNQYGTMNTPFKGSKVPFTNYTIPGYNLGIGKGWTIAATGDLTAGFGSMIPGVDNISVNSKDEISLEDILMAETSGMTPIQAHSLMELQAQAQAQPQQYIQATPSQVQQVPQQYTQATPQVQQVPQQGTSGSRPLTPADWEMFEHQLNAYSVAS